MMGKDKEHIKTNNLMDQQRQTQIRTDRGRRIDISLRAAQFIHREIIEQRRNQSQ